VTAWAVVAIVLIGNHLTGPKQVSDTMYATVAPILAAEAAKAYESGGPRRLHAFRKSRNDDRARKLFLLDRFYEDVLGRAVTDDGIRVAHAAKDGQLVLLRRNMAINLSLPRGVPIYCCSLSNPLRKLGDSLVLLITLLCFALAYHIASPIHSIQ